MKSGRPKLASDLSSYSINATRYVLGMVLGVLSLVQAAPSLAQGLATGADAPTAGGPIRLRQPQQAQEAAPAKPDQPVTPVTTSVGPNTGASVPERPKAPVAATGEFEAFVQRLEVPGTPVARRLGIDLATRAFDSAALDSPPLVPPDYIVAPGDEVLITMWGSLDADLRLIVDRAGRVNIPRVGSITLSGVRHADLASTISRRVGQVFKNFEVSATVGALRGIRVFITGFAVSPGAYQVHSLSTITSALFRAGGPSAGGSYRRVNLLRGGQVASRFDLYDFLLNGNRTADVLLQAGDVIHIEQVGDEVGVIGSVQRPAILELKPGETIADVLRMTGGLTAVADRSRLTIERLSERNSARILELALPAGLGMPLQQGDVLRALSAVDAVLSIDKKNSRVRVEGEVARPGIYILPPDSTLQDALRMAGGLTPAAFIFGTEFSRESVRLTQQQNYERALRDLEIEVARQGTTRVGNTTDEVAAGEARAAATARLLERLRASQPTGRIVLQVPIDGSELPPLVVQNGDRLFVPPRPTAVGVFGSVFNAGSYIYNPGRTLDDYTRLAGGPQNGADEESVFVVRANGGVVSAKQSRSSWLTRSSSFSALDALPGDTIFVPEKINKTTFLQGAKDWTQILFQLGVGLAGIKNAFQ